MSLLTDLEKEVYVAVHEGLGGTACRILVPGYSEIYPIEDLVWNNTNMALEYRSDILNIHELSDSALTDLFERLDESQMDNYTLISTLIGIEFDENTVGGKLDIGELKLLIHLALKQYDDAKDLTVDFLSFNDNSVERKMFYQALNIVLDITLDEDLDLNDYLPNLTRMYGAEAMVPVLGSIAGDVRFYGLTKTSMKLEDLDKHLRLIESYQKLHQARAARV